MVNYYNPRSSKDADDFEQWLRHGQERGFLAAYRTQGYSWQRQGPFTSQDHDDAGARQFQEDWSGAAEWQRPKFTGDSEQVRRLTHHGRGSRNYKRSDQRVREDIMERLTVHQIIDATDVEVEVRDGQVMLTGMVRSRCEKRLVEDVIENVYGVNNVGNHLKVQQITSDQSRSDQAISAGQAAPKSRQGTAGNSSGNNHKT